MKSSARADRTWTAGSDVSKYYDGRRLHMTFDQIVKNHHRPAVLFGQKTVKSQLIADLEQNRKLNRRLCSVYFALVVAVALAAIGAIVAGMITGKSELVGLLSGAGVTVTGALVLTKSAVQEWSRSDLLIVLAKSSDEQHL